MRPVDPYAVADLAAQQRVAGNAERLCLGVEHRIFDRPQPLADNPARRRPGQAIKFGVDPLVLENILPADTRAEPLDHRADPGGTKALVELAPAGNAAIRRQFQKMVIPPSGVAAQDFQTGDLHGIPPSPLQPRPGQSRVGRAPSETVMS